MNILKKLLCVFSAVMLLLAAGMVPVSADKIVKEGPFLSVGKYTAVPLDTVVVNIESAAPNPGVMAMTFTISYDPTAFEYVDYHKGLSKDRLFVDHPDKGYVSFVSCETHNFFHEGTLFSLEFKVKETAKPGFYEMKIRNVRPETNGDSMTGCFADWKGNKFNPTITNGGVTVGETCVNMGHSFSSWKETVKPLCKEKGFKTRTCSRCGHIQTEEIPAIGKHSYNDFWTIDFEAADGKSGEMSRHCSVCSESTDKKTFTKADADNNGFNNTENESVKEEQWAALELPKESSSVVSSTVTSDTSIPQVSEPQSSEETTSSEEKIPDANDMVNSAKKEKDGFGVKIYRYLFGDDEQKGVFAKIYDAFPNWIKEISPIWVLVLGIIAIAIIAVI